MVTHAICQCCEEKKINGKTRYPPTEHKSFRRPKDSYTQRGSPMNFRGGVREKKSTEKSVINLLVMKFFDSRTFLIYRSAPQRNFLAPRQKNIDGNLWYSVLLHKIFRYFTFEIFWNIRWFLAKFFGTVRPKKPKENRDTHESFRDPRFSET